MPTTATDEAAATDASNPITASREQIDALDAAIIDLIAERARVSRRIQTARIHSGGTRVELSRERVILNTYRAALGRTGAHLADAVLQVCRGER
ncbi:MAG: chorismate mutase [Trebonia sp.]